MRYDTNYDADNLDNKENSDSNESYRLVTRDERDCADVVPRKRFGP